MEKDKNVGKILKILLIEDEPAECAAISRYVESTEGVQLIGATNSIGKAYSDVCDFMPDAVILDMELHKGEGDGINFLEKLAYSSVIRPFILVTTDNTSKTVFEKARSLGADFIISKSQENYSAEYVIDFLISMKSTIFFRKNRQGLPEDVLTVDDPEETTRRILKRIDTELDQIGINPKVLGRKYLIDAIIMTMVKPEPNFCGVIAQKYNKSSQSINHAMSTAIVKAWSKTPMNELRRYYTAIFDARKGYPTFSEFVHYYARKIKSDL
ncbi:MAG: response regulator [Oscillospiraceae bacterium]|nr:response regulator [Oscillospiraceae bacterium]